MYRIQILVRHQKHSSTGQFFFQILALGYSVYLDIYQRIGKSSLGNLKNGFLVSLEDTPFDIQKDL